jgi:cytochrome c6
MKMGFTAVFTIVLLCSLATNGVADTKKKGEIDGRKDFKKHCFICHPNGGNVMKPTKPLWRKRLEANNVKGVDDIIAKMRKPGPGMPRFKEKKISDKEAKGIAEYILKTFK